MSNGFSFMNNPLMTQAQNMFRGMTGHYQLPPDSTKSFDLSQNYGHNFDDDGHSKDFLVNQLRAQLGSALESRSQLINQLKQVYENEIVQTILATLVADAFESISSTSFMTVEYDDGTISKYPSKVAKTIQAEIDKFYAMNDLVGLARDIIPDFMLQGEYFIKTKVVPGEGIVEIVDNCNTEDFLALYKGRTLDAYYKYNKKSGKYAILPRQELSHFVLDANRIKLKIESYDDEMNLPETVRVGRSVVFPVLDSVRKLNILETTALATELKRVLAPILISVDIQPDTDVQNITNIIDKYENYLNDINMDSQNSDSMSLQDIMYSASRIRVVPKFSDSKGSIEQIRFDYDNADLNTRINDVRKNIAMSLGIPSFHLAYGDQLLGKQDTLKLYSAYARKLVGIQTSFGNGIRALVHKHLMYKNLYVDESNIKVKFKTISNVDMIDDIEVLVAVTTVLNDLFALFASLGANDQFGIEIEQKELIALWRSFTASFPHFRNVLKLYNEKGLDGKLKDGGFEMPLHQNPPADLSRSGGGMDTTTPSYSTTAPSGAGGQAGMAGSTPENPINATNPQTPVSGGGGGVDINQAF